MKRREFLRAAVGGTTAAALGVRPPFPRYQPSFQRWTWVHGGGERTAEEWQDQYARLAGSGFHGVLVGGGNASLHARAAHSAGLEFHRWIWTLNRSGDAWVKENHPEWFTVSRNGASSLEQPPYVGYYNWLCPTRPEVRAYLRDVILEIARDPGVDGIHLDYIRHCDVILPRGLWARYDLVQDREYPEFDFCYCEVCRDTFAATHGYDPLELPDPPSDEAWRRFRWDSVTGVVRVLTEAVHSVPRRAPSLLRISGMGKPISAAVFPTPSIARRLVRQAWDEWGVDAVMPMLYQSFYERGVEWIGAGVAEGLMAMEARSTSGRPSPKQLLAGLYLPALPGADREQATEIALEAGAQGVSFFEMHGLDL